MDKQIKQLEEEKDFLIRRLNAIDNIEKINLEISNLKFEQNKEKLRGNLSNRIEIKEAQIDQAKEDQKFYEKEKVSWEVMFKRYERGLQEMRDKESDRMKLLKDLILNSKYDWSNEQYGGSLLWEKINEIFGNYNRQQDTFVNLESGESKHDLKEKGSEGGTSADLTSNARGLEEADEDTSRSLAAGNPLIKYFENPKDCKEYLENEAKPGEEVILDERATGTHPRRVNHFKKEVKQDG